MAEARYPGADVIDIESLSAEKLRLVIHAIEEGQVMKEIEGRYILKPITIDEKYVEVDTKTYMSVEEATCAAKEWLGHREHIDCIEIREIIKVETKFEVNVSRGW